MRKKCPVSFNDTPSAVDTNNLIHVPIISFSLEAVNFMDIIKAYESNEVNELTKEKKL